jgi:hypothetical protein
MPKLKLDREALAVETFATTTAGGPRGTVRGARRPRRHAGGGHRVHGPVHERRVDVLDRELWEHLRGRRPQRQHRTQPSLRRSRCPS